MPAIERGPITLIRGLFLKSAQGDSSASLKHPVIDSHTARILQLALTYTIRLKSLFLAFVH